MRKCAYSILFLLSISSFEAYCQDSLSVGFHSIFNDGSNPFWIYSNKNGLISTSDSYLYTNIAFNTERNFSNTISSEIGFDIVARTTRDNSILFNQAYLKFYNRYLQFTVGKFDNSTSINNSITSMGSLGVSGNSNSIPQIRAGTNEWISIPDFNFIELKGHISHGWLDKNSYIDRVFYHEKVAYLKFGGDSQVNFFGGIAHYVLWGGRNHPQYGDLPSAFSDFLKIFIAVGGDENAPPGDQNYILGNHLGTWDTGFDIQFPNMSVLLYRQFPIETKENLRFESLRDGLTGIDITIKKGILGLKGITYEFLYTKYQRGPFRPDPDNERYPFKGNENYYNNGLYRTGWTYKGFTIGNPLFIQRDNDLGIANNRIVAHHIGLKIFPSKLLTTYLNITLSNNHGNWGSKVLDRPEMGIAYDPPKRQTSIWIKTSYKKAVFSTPMDLFFQFGIDRGDLVGNNIGTNLGFVVSF